MEFFDVYNDKKEKTGEKLPRKGSFLKEGQYQLIVLALLKWAAGDWEVSGGGVQSGETSFEGVCREVREETGIDVSHAEGGCVYTYSNVDLKRGDNYFVDIYHFHLDFDEKDVCLQKSEAIGFQIVPFAEIRKLAEAGKFLHYTRILEAFDSEGYVPEL